jgi:hypothetical protein
VTAPPITLRFPPVTLRYREPPVSGGVAVTLRYAEGAAAAIPPLPATAFGGGTPTAGQVIADHYRVEQGPLGGSTGEGEVYRCRRGEAVVAVKLYRPGLEPKEEVLATLRGLAHPQIVRLLEYGRWQGRFYEVMAFCHGGVLADLMPLHEIALRGYLPDIVAALDYCHRQGIVHRDIKPNNLFLPDLERRRVQLGDFGISSHLEPQAGGVRVTATAGQLTLDYAAPELLDGHQVSPKTDYYALGITLLHLLEGRSPFHGRGTGDILVAHLRGRIPLPDSLSDPFRLLIQGLLHYDPTARWGQRELLRWLHGEDVRLAPPRPGRLAAPPYPGFPEVSDLKGLAGALERFDAARQLLRGDIRRWVFDHFDAALAERIEALEQAHPKDPWKALARLRYLLDPEQPLWVAGEAVTSLGRLADLIEQQPVALRQAWDSESIDTWIAAGRLAGERSDELVQRIAGIRERLPHSRETALFALLHTLDPARPLRLPNGAVLQNPGDLAELYRQGHRPAVEQLSQLLFSQRLEEWIRGARFKGWERDLAFVERARKDYLERQLQGAYCVLWHFVPQIPFRFDGKRIAGAADLARLIDASPERQRRGLQLLEQGWIRAWLVGTGQIWPPTELDHLLLALDLSPEAKLEEVLRLLDPSLPAPGLAVHPSAVLFGAQPQGASTGRNLRISGTGRGHLHGVVVLERYGEGITLDNYRIEGRTSEVEVRLHTLGLAPGRYRNRLWLRTNAGEREVEVLYVVQEREEERAWWQRYLAG